MTVAIVRFGQKSLIVIPAHFGHRAGIHFATAKNQWIPAFAGMTIILWTQSSA
jgi:hypothetical protein